MAHRFGLSLHGRQSRRFRRQRRGAGLHAGMPRSMQTMKRSSPVSSLACPVTRFGPYPAPGGTCAALLSGLLSQSKFGPLLQNARLGTWEPGLSLRLRQWVTRPIREFKQRRLTMYQNRITLIGFLGQDAITHTANNASFTVLSLATKSSYKDKKTGKYIDHTEWHRCIVWGQSGRVREDAHEGRASVRRRRAAQPRARGQEDQRQAARMGSARGFDPEARPRREGQPGRAADDEFNPEEEAA